MKLRMRKKKGWALLLAAALLTGILPVGTAPVSKAEETSASAGKYGLKNPVVKAVSPPGNTSHGLSNPRNEDGTVTWDCVYFGNYWQNDTNGDGVADKDDEKQPIKWRVLSVDGDDAFLLADTNLDVQKYNDTYEDVTWETCTMRSWLNGYGADTNVCEMDYSDSNFLDNAFTESEQAAIQNTTVVNEDNPFDDVEDVNDPIDKVYFLSLSEAMNPLYGFTSTTDSTDTRKAINTAYVAAGGEIKSSYINSAGSTDEWWLRWSGISNDYTSHVNSDGNVVQAGNSVSHGLVPVRPVLHLNLSSDLEWKKAGMVSSDGGETIVTWDCVWFGNYPQSDSTGVAKDPIKWRVLSVNGDDAFLLADTNLDVQEYSDTPANIIWETCMMRTWLNSTFLNKAFSASEQAAIQNTTVVNEDNPYYDTEGGNDTVDKVYLLSLSEAMNPSYGFTSTIDSTDKREAVNTAYVAAGGETKSSSMNSAGSTDIWWLRSPGGQGSFSACYVTNSGGVGPYGHSVGGEDIAVRPALHLNLSSVSSWLYAGTVSSAGEKNEISDSNPPVTPSPSETPSPSAGGSSVVGTSSAGQNPVAVTSLAPAQNTPVAKQGEVQKTDEKTTPAKVTGLKLKAKKKAIEASWKKVSGATGYEIQVSTSKKFTKKSTKTTKKTKLTIGKLKPKTKYFVRVRAYHVVTNGKKTYGKWSKMMNVKTKK